MIFSHAGDDFTDVFAAFHPPSALNSLEKFYIGDLDDSTYLKEEEKKFREAYRNLRSKLLAMGMFKSDGVYYFYKVMSNFAILAAAIACAVMSSSFWVNMAGALLLGLFWQQSGWLAHDFLHHQVFRNRAYGNYMGILLGNVCQGFSVGWWTSKHNTHHAVPNLHSSSPDAADGDPDIDTMPILAWSLKMAESAKNSDMGRFLIKWQSVFYFPVLLFARLAWAHQSWVFVFGGAGQHSVKLAEVDKKKMRNPFLEKAGLIVHYIGLLYVMSFMPLLNALAYFIVAQTSCGLMLALVFGLGHNGMAVYPANERPDFWKLQVSTTRNITSNWFVDWFCGGLHYQVDHHLFPMLPRHNLKQVHGMVADFCREHNVTYHETDMIQGTVEVLSHLSKVAHEFATEFPAM